MALLLLILAIVILASYLVWKIPKSMKGCKCLVEKPKETQLAETPKTPAEPANAQNEQVK
ncbi:MAG: hypothetical protein COZ91_03130 [Candidatus Nealsonbacteria bacterium CG_4_8_14_3_um_filter_39_7]|uniref:Uncharacterized protein n=1 Tax=Candidatus Nealsonbacteria bacterium CG23_combo_of_CG06-09_8_20_14_all_39_17 TaxID=1974722 RepID=A0A2G9YVC6_9BACT|nr:MAG: hypothetical protein COX37_00090 [Candidatus Nealsonbacteria bacterium CG23_combo_of_CG06-09_8_20_14_all_39_17]PIU43965.1 MAG: hypothetical protein COS96_01580 [Candidatus Nealsonbacteria bacterium CG07_land_8_20_14_0_80_39_13]PIW90933.1 MAG: hypothetical protein COZ91_03130 [Candidatus Nealsonbacteria bacterium CG_4_8_14_3_um_filter_39_7]